ncbi:2-octaprenyl-6-methoxyphenyl hydroxylase [Thioclava sp. SK-1]|uniref:UbiH/UbiF/VisC/COQ6 family ubiquinone biosynthesis hydroxylase n=1 Tax=Thioclava sp. SK-1 TaxID=1889770 RepID=UPI000826D6F1|nr:UbiH/UbiF/VisC/COQ6 family ubiquinone biosynthesis hydroxylase [Thioclava sp. SK-1]OCX59844.1 2-octaprenyl-6-methoxyphenyl hydroxylase [Thioclava sp. SK-1]
MKTECDIIIVGGGLNGPALALAVAGIGLSVTVVDAAPAQARGEHAFDGRAYALAAASKNLLSAIGLWPQLADKAQPMMGVKASDGHPGEGASPLFLHFDAHELDTPPVGWMLEDRFLSRALCDAMLAHDNITLISDTRVIAQDIEASHVSVTLSDDRRLTARMLIGADGRASGVGARAAIKREGWGYGQTALVAAIAHELPHDGIAHQFFMPTGPLAILPLTGNRSSIVWSETDNNAHTIAALDDGDFLGILRPRFGDFLGQIELAGPRFSYPLSLTLATSYVKPRLALVGDAAHGVHPIAGQGLNLGLRDVGALAEVIADALRRGEDIGALNVLERYQGWRRFDATSLALGMDTVNTLFSNTNPLLRLGRDLGMGLVNKIGPMRRGLMRQAAGLSGPLPRLMSGKPL